MDKGTTVDVQHAVAADGRNVGGGAVALVGGEAIFRMEFIIFVHDMIPGDFGHDAGCRNTETFGVSFDNPLLGDLDSGYGHRICQDIIRNYMNAVLF